MMKSPHKASRICLAFTLILTISASACAPAMRKNDTKETNPNQALTTDKTVESVENISPSTDDGTLVIEESSVEEADSFPNTADSAFISGSPVGMNPMYYVFDVGLTYYRYDKWTDKTYKITLSLPKGYTDGEIVAAERGGGSGELYLIVKAAKNGAVEYLEYYLYSENLQPVSLAVNRLDEERLALLKEAQNYRYLDIYRCDDVYRTADTKSYGDATVYIPIALTDYNVKDIQVVFCPDECEKKELTLTALSGYARVYPIVCTEKYSPTEGWNYPTERYTYAFPDGFFAESEYSDAHLSPRYERDYIYLLTFDEYIYVFINIVPNDINSSMPECEIDTVSAIVKETVIHIDFDNTEYTVDFPLEDDRDYITLAGVYGKDIGNCYPHGNIIHAANDGTLYYVMGIGNEWWSAGNFKDFRTYKVTSKNGYIESVEETETLTKNAVLKNGSPYQGEPDGLFSCLAYRFVQGNFDHNLRGYSVYIQPDGTIDISSTLVGTGPAVEYSGTYLYDDITGNFTAKLTGRYANNGEITIYPEAEVSGKLYEYGGFVHFICEKSGIHPIDANDPLPLTFVPNTDGYATPKEAKLADTFDGVWDCIYADESGEHTYRLSVMTDTAQIQFDDGIGDGKNISRYVGTYTVNPLTGVKTANLRSLYKSAKESEFTLKFTLGYMSNADGTTLILDIRSCDAASLGYLVEKTLCFNQNIDK